MKDKNCVILSSFIDFYELLNHIRTDLLPYLLRSISANDENIARYKISKYHLFILDCELEITPLLREAISKAVDDEQISLVNKAIHLLSRLSTQLYGEFLICHLCPVAMSIENQSHPVNVNGLKSQTGFIDYRIGQLYFSSPGGYWKEVKNKSNKFVQISDIDSYFIVKFGYHGNNTGRHGTHKSGYGYQYTLLDSMPSPVAAAAEMKIKDLLKNDGRLYSALHSNKKSRDNELIIVRSQEEYDAYVIMAKNVIWNLESSIRPDPELKFKPERFEEVKQMEHIKANTRLGRSQCNVTVVLDAFGNLLRINK